MSPTRSPFSQGDEHGQCFKRLLILARWCLMQAEDAAISVRDIGAEVGDDGTADGKDGADAVRGGVGGDGDGLAPAKVRVE